MVAKYYILLKLAFGMKLMDYWACCVVRLTFGWAHQCSAYLTLVNLPLTMLVMWPSWGHPGKEMH